jgi:hypothetical protein
VTINVCSYDKISRFIDDWYTSIAFEDIYLIKEEFFFFSSWKADIASISIQQSIKLSIIEGYCYSNSEQILLKC